MRLLPQDLVFRKFLFTHFLLESQFWFPVWMLFLDYKGFDLSTMVIADAIFRFTMVAFEYPMGVLSDRIGRKRTYIIIHLLAIITYSGIVLINSKASLYGIWIIWGIFWALSSGASSAYCYELIQKQKVPEQKTLQFFGFMRATSNLAALFSHLLAGFLFAILPEYPFILNGGFAFISLFIALSLPNTALGQNEGWSTSLQLRSFLSMIYKNKTIFTCSILLALSLIYFWSPRILIQPSFLELGTPPTLISVIYFTYSLAGILAGLMANKLRQLLGNLLSVFLGIFCIWIGVLLIGSMPSQIAIFFIPLMSFGYYLANTLLEVFLHHELKDRYRASILSFVSFLAGIVIIASRPFLGIIADLKGSQYAFLVWAFLGILFLIVSIFFLRKLPKS